MVASKKLGIALLGLGRMGSIHAQNLVLSGRAQLKWLVKNDLDAARQFAERLAPMAKCVTPAQLDTVLEDKSVDGVVIASLTSQHEGQIRASLQAGKSVFCEKPITPTIETTRDCYEIAVKQKRVLFCGFHRRFDPSFLDVFQHLRAQTAGSLRLVRISSHDLSPPPLHYIKNSGGIFKDSTIHDIDMALWMSGSPAKTVYVSGQAFNPDVRSCGDLDLVVVTIMHENGTMTVIDNGRRCAHGYDQRLEVLCEDGSYVVTNRCTHLLTRHSVMSSVTPGIDQQFDTRYPQAYANEMEHFLDILEGKTTPRVTKDDTLSVMALAEAAMESAKTGKPVQL